MTTNLLPSDLVRDEGLKYRGYKDSLGFWTCGVGHHDATICENTRWTYDQAMLTLQQDIKKCEDELDEKLPWWRKMNDVRQDGLVNLCFMGIGYPPHDGKPGKGLLSFDVMLGLLEKEEYGAAAAHLLNSDYAHETKSRAGRIAALFIKGAR